MKPAQPEIGEKKPCEEDVYFALVSKDGSSPAMFFCRKHALEFMAMVSIEAQADILAKGAGMLARR